MDKLVKGNLELTDLKKIIIIKQSKTRGLAKVGGT